jgi:hypothetical protein
LELLEKEERVDFLPLLSSRKSSWKRFLLAVGIVGRLIDSPSPRPQLLGLREVGRSEGVGFDCRDRIRARSLPRSSFSFSFTSYLFAVLMSASSRPSARRPLPSSQIDRKDQIYQNYYLTFPHQDGAEYNHSNTVLDGEFVIDVDPVTGAVRFSSPVLPVFETER